MDYVIVSTCMNRNEYLLRSLPSWLGTGAPVVLVDWSSATPLRHAVGGLPRRVSLVEVAGKEVYDNSRARNLALRAAQTLHPEARYVLSLDCDVLIQKASYFHALTLRNPNVFQRGDLRIPGPGVSKAMRYASWLKPFRNLANCGLVGSFWAPLDLVRHVNGFDERMSGYGYFDNDLYTRMTSLGGAREMKIERGVLYHQPHAARTQNYKEKDAGASMRRNARIVRERSWDTSFRQELQQCRVNGTERTL